MSDLIDRQAAIETVMECYDNDELFEVYEDKLRELPPAQPNVHDLAKDADCISRQAAITALSNEIVKRRLLDEMYDGCIDEFQTEEILKKLPPAQPERIKGHWIAMEKKNLFHCSECGAVIYSESEYDRNEFHKFCGRCGAEMEVTT